MLEWLFEPSWLTNGMVLSLILSCGVMVFWTHEAREYARIADSGAKKLVQEIVKGVARESILLKALMESKIPGLDAVLNQVRVKALLPDRDLVVAIVEARAKACGEDCDCGREEGDRHA